MIVKMSGPMNFSTSPEQDALVDIARRFGQQHLAPFYQQREREGAFDRPTLREMGRLGREIGLEMASAFKGVHKHTWHGYVKKDRPSTYAQDRAAILRMVAEGRITPDEGEMLLSGLEG